MLTSIKQQVLTATFFSFGSLVITNPAFAASIDLTTWQQTGDVATSSGQVTFTTGTYANTDVDDLESFLGVTLGSLSNTLAPTSFVGVTQGSAIENTLSNIQAGSTFSFSWNFTQDGNDSAFVTVGNSVVALSGNSPFSYTFNSPGNYTIGIGAVDVDDVIGVSTLTVSNASLQSSQSVPEPITLLGSLAALGFGTAMRRRFRN